jgi:nucleotide-binding universal stress UspA family protein
MYKRILVALENSNADASLLPHVSKLARLTGAHLFLVHVADGWAARHFDRLKLVESEEMKADRNYLAGVAEQLRKEGRSVSARLALGDPPEEILKVAEEEQCDLIAMTSHGHRFLADLFLGSTIHTVRHRTSIPVLLVKAGTRDTAES